MTVGLIKSDNALVVPARISELEKFLIKNKIIEESLDVLIGKVAIKSMQNCEQTFSNNAKNLCYERICKHVDDVFYLARKTRSIVNVLVVMCSRDYIGLWTEMFSPELSVLKAQNYITDPDYPISNAYNGWLAKHTSYPEIMSKVTKTKGSCLEYDVENFYFKANKFFLKRIFLEVARIFEDVNKNAKIFHTSVPTTNFIVYKDRHKANYYSVILWCKNEDYKLGEGTYGVAWKVLDIGLGRIFALKEAKGDELFALSKDGIRRELCAWKALKKNHVGLVSMPDVLVVEPRFSALASHCYQGDLHAFLDQIAELSTVSVRDLLQAFSEALHGLQALRVKRIAHRDIRQGNIFFEFREADKRLSFVLADLGLTETYARIIAEKTTDGYGDLFSVDEDVQSLKEMYARKDIDLKEIELLLEKREVYAFGMTMCRTLIGLNQYIGCIPQNYLGLVFSRKYGVDMSLLCKRMLQSKHEYRPTIAEALQEMKTILSRSDEENEWLTRPIFEVIKPTGV